MRVDLIAVEGAHDLAFVQRLLSAFGFERKRKLDNPENPSENIPSEVRELVPKTFPTNEERDIHKRSDVPAFHVKDEQCVVLISTGGDSKLVGGVSSAIVILDKTDIRPSSIGFILDADSNLPKQFDKLKTEWGEKSPPASGQRNAGRWLAGARFLQVLNEGHFGMREGAWQG